MDRLTPDKYLKINIEGFDFYFSKDGSIVDDESNLVKAKSILQQTVRSAKASHIKDLLPFRKPKIVIADLTDHNISYRKTGTTPAYYSQGIIYIDEFKIHSVDLFVHEYAHYLVDRVSKQTEPILIKAYDDMLKEYYRRTKRKKIDLKDRRSDSKKTMEIKLSERKIIARYLGFPSEYGLNDFHEFFAEVITNWKKMPNNSATYVFKKLVKQVISRL